MDISTQDKLLSPAEAASYLSVRRATLDVWRCLGKGPGYVKITEGQSGRVRYRLSDLDRWIRERSVAAGGERDTQAVQQ